jgi:nicotinate-nucleotide adenylyltransferase
MSAAARSWVMPVRLTELRGFTCRRGSTGPMSTRRVSWVVATPISVVLCGSSNRHGPILAAVRTGILGGTFDPIHVAHLHTAECALDQAGLDRVLIIPAGDPWQKSGREVTPGKHRLEMCRLAITGGQGLEVDLRELDRDGPTYTVETLGTFPSDEELFLILGSDSLAGIETWHRWQDVVDRVTLIEAPRTATPRGVGERLDAIQLDMGFLEVSSTDIRRRVAERRPYRYLVTDPIYRYIEATNLYAEIV